MNILLTGATGFIGRNINESYLSDKYKLITPEVKELDLIDDGSVRDFFLNNEIDIVIHAAAKPGHRNTVDVSNLLYLNSRMFFNIARNADKFKKFINIGSGAIYDMRYYQPKMIEEFYDNHVPIDEHGYNKYICYKYIELTDKIIDLRIFGIFGKYEDYAIRFISNMICKTIFSIPMTMHQNRKFDYLFIDDLMPILEFFIENDSSFKCYNVTPDCSIELYLLAEKIKILSGKKIPIVVAKDGMGLEYSGDNTRLKNEIKMLKLTAIDDSLYVLYKWYYDNRELINKSLLLYDK